MSDLTVLWRYWRPELANRLATRLLDHERIAMFGHRQTGKTTLVHLEIIPAVTRQGALAVYVECWANKADPLSAINYALLKVLEGLTLQPKGFKRTANTPVKGITVLGTGVTLGDEPRRTLPSSPLLQFDSLLTQILEQTRKDVVLFFDEFQVLAEVDGGDAVCAAIRAALSQVASRVGALFFGSNDILLNEMFARARTPLYGFAKTESYELLDERFVGHVAQLFKESTKRELGLVDAMSIFHELGRQPEPFLHAIGLVMANPKWQASDGLAAMLSPPAQNRWARVWAGLTGLQQLALHLAHEGKPVTAADSRAWAAGKLGVKSVSASSLQRAVESLLTNHLVEKVPGGRGYEVAEPVMRAWLKRNPNAEINLK